MRRGFNSRGSLAGLTPLLDTMFLLLFALLAASDVRASRSREPVRVRLPEVQASEEAPAAGPIVFLSVDQDGLMFVDGVGGPYLDLQELDRALTEASGGAVPEEVLVELRGDRGAPYGTIASLLQHLRLGGYARVDLLAEGGTEQH